jgi:hypothetical protein
MKIKKIMALSLLIVIVGLQVSCSQYAVAIEKVIVERDVDRFSTHFKIKCI